MDKLTDQMSQIKPFTISISEFMTYFDYKIEPIFGLSIPNILIPDELSCKYKYQDVKTYIITNIRQMFNSITVDNINTVKENLRTLIIEKAKNTELLDEIASEFLSNFVVSHQTIENYMHLLNAVSPACILINKNETSLTIGNMFLEKCRIAIFNSIDEKHIRHLAMFDQDDDDDLDKYNRERDKINNLIITICYLYGQRKKAKLCVSLNINQIYPLISMIMTAFLKCSSIMTDLGNPYKDEECKDEEEYIIRSKMLTLYGEHLYIFMSEKGEEFIADQSLFNDRYTLKSLMLRLKDEIYPKISESFLISKYEDLFVKLNI